MISKPRVEEVGSWWEQAWRYSRFCNNSVLTQLLYNLSSISCTLRYKTCAQYVKHAPPPPPPSPFPPANNFRENTCFSLTFSFYFPQIFAQAHHLPAQNSICKRPFILPNFRTKNMAEQDCFPKAFVYLLKNIPRKDLLYPLYEAAFEVSQKCFLSMSSMKLCCFTQSFVCLSGHWCNYHTHQGHKEKTITNCKSKGI